MDEGRSGNGLRGDYSTLQGATYHHDRAVCQERSKCHGELTAAVAHRFSIFAMSRFNPED